MQVTNVKCMRMAFDDTQRPPNKCMVKIKKLFLTSSIINFIYIYIYIYIYIVDDQRK